MRGLNDKNRKPWLEEKQVLKYYLYYPSPNIVIVNFFSFFLICLYRDIFGDSIIKTVLHPPWENYTERATTGFEEYLEHIILGDENGLYIIYFFIAAFSFYNIYMNIIKY